MLLKLTSVYGHGTGRPEKGSFDYSASGQSGAGPLGPEVGGEGQGDEELRRKRTSSQGEKGSDEVGEGDSGDIVNSQLDGNWISRSSNRVCFGWIQSNRITGERCTPVRDARL